MEKQKERVVSVTARLFSIEGQSQYTRAVQCWQVLITAARQCRILTYAGLSREMGMDENALPVVGTNALNVIGHYCTANGLPQLTRVAVGQNTGLPGQDAPEDVRTEDVWRVFTFDWLDVVPPTAQDFAEASGKKPSQSSV